MKISKKLFLFALISVLIVLVLLSGCAEYQVSNEGATDNISLNAPSKIISDNIVSYCAKEKSEENRIYFNYPQFKETVNNADKLNELIVVLVKTAIQVSDGVFKGTLKDSPEIWEWNEDEYTHLAMNISYKITRSDSDYFSVTFEGEYNHKFAAHPIHYFRSIIIDLKKCEVVSLSDLYVINMEFIKIYLENLKKAVNQGRFTAMEEEWMRVTEIIENSDFLVMNFEKADAGGVSSYLTEEGLGISYSVGRAFADHLETIIKYEEIERFKL